MAEATPDGYASELRREILRSEIQRVQVLAVVLTVLLVTTMTAATLLADLVQRIFRDGLAWWEPLAAVGKRGRLGALQTGKPEEGDHLGSLSVDVA